MATSPIEVLPLALDKVGMDIKDTSLLDFQGTYMDFLLDKIDYSNLVSKCA